MHGLWFVCKKVGPPPITNVLGIAALTNVLGIAALMDISLWTNDELAEGNLNSKGLHALFIAMSTNKFREISMCEAIKEVWDISETTYEGTKMVKNSKLQMLTLGLKN